MALPPSQFWDKSRTLFVLCQYKNDITAALIFVDSPKVAGSGEIPMMPPQRPPQPIGQGRGEVKETFGEELPYECRGELIVTERFVRGIPFAKCWVEAIPAELPLPLESRAGFAQVMEAGPERQPLFGLLCLDVQPGADLVPDLPLQHGLPKAFRNCGHVYQVKKDRVKMLPLWALDRFASLCPQRLVHG